MVAQISVDASLPPPSGPAPMAPLDMRESLAQLSDPAGLLPPWTQWWEPADLARLFPSEEARVQVEAGQPRLPLSYFDGAVPIAEGWDAMPSGYVAFGDTYAKAAERAARLGWPVRTLNGAHLHMLVDPESVAGTITELVAALGVPSPA